MIRSLLPALLLVVPAVASAGTYDAFADFKNTQNPAGVWSYGKVSGTGAFQAYATNQLIGNNIRSWSQTNNSAPFVRKNTSGADVVDANTLYPKAGFLVLQPGSTKTAKFSAIRFTAPTTGCYSVDARFKSQRQGTQGATANAFVDVNGVEEWTKIVKGFTTDAAKVFAGATGGANNNYCLDAGDTIDFIVGPGAGSPISNTNDFVGAKIIIIDDQDGDGIEDSEDTTAVIPAADLVAGDLVITELMYDPNASEPGSEWFEIYNASGSDVDLTGLRIVDAAAAINPNFVHTVGSPNGPVVVPAGAYYVLGSGYTPGWQYTSFTADYLYNQYPQLNNSGSETLRLENPGMVIIDTVTYSDPTAAGVTAILDGGLTPSATANDDAANWCGSSTTVTLPWTGSTSSGTDYGSPGEGNDACP